MLGKLLYFNIAPTQPFFTKKLHHRKNDFSLSDTFFGFRNTLQASLAVKTAIKRHVLDLLSCFIEYFQQKPINHPYVHAISPSFLYPNKRPWALIRKVMPNYRPGGVYLGGRVFGKTRYHFHPSHPSGDPSGDSEFRSLRVTAEC